MVGNGGDDLRLGGDGDDVIVNSGDGADTIDGGDGKVNAGQGIGAQISADGTLHVAYGAGNPRVLYRAVKGGRPGAQQPGDVDAAKRAVVGPAPVGTCIGIGEIGFVLHSRRCDNRFVGGHAD